MPTPSTSLNPSSPLPDGISAHTTFTVRSALGAFEERGVPTVGAAERRLDLLNRIEQAMAALGSPGTLGATEFLSGRGCLAHTPHKVEIALSLMREVNNEYGGQELRRAGITSISPRELHALETPSDYADLVPRLARFSDNPYVDALTRMACIVGRTSEEWRTVELAERVRASTYLPVVDPAAARNFVAWTRLPTSVAAACGQTVKALTLRDKFEPQLSDLL